MAAEQPRADNDLAAARALAKPMRSSPSCPQKRGHSGERPKRPIVRLASISPSEIVRSLALSLPYGGSAQKWGTVLRRSADHSAAQSRERQPRTQCADKAEAL